ncbi:MAG: GNAT family N-acetyltransferase [Firmicutes bacterium]|nr:GNAT family N-acetyltransferase [Bacillota bacterium]
MSNVIIRKANSNDANGKGYVHYKSWIETYTGLFPEEIIDHLSLERSIQIAKDHPENTYIAIVDGKIVGFSSYLEARDDDSENSGEIVAVYVLKDYQGKGIGKRLMKVCYQELSHFKKILLWVLKSNLKAIRFYESEKFISDGKTKLLYGKEVIRMIKE